METAANDSTGFASVSDRWRRNAVSSNSLKLDVAYRGIIITIDLPASAGRPGWRSSEMPMDDPALVEALRAGDPQAPRLLIEQYQGVVFGLCYRMMNHRQDAEDVAQETFVRALRSMAGFDAARPIRPWLLEIAANRCRTALARRSRRPILRVAETTEDMVDPRGGRPDPDDLAGELERALSGLRPEYRLVFVLFHEQNLSYEEIAGALSRPVGTVKTWLHRARAELAEYLSRRGVQC
jgi:RNA polymerase sigma factor (sigma-70 family)